MVPDNLLDIIIIFISITFITMIVIPLALAVVYIVNYYRENQLLKLRVVTELREKLRGDD